MSMLFCYWGLVALIAAFVFFIYLPLKEEDRRRAAKEAADAKARREEAVKDEQRRWIDRAMQSVRVVQKWAPNTPQTCRSYQIWVVQWKWSPWWYFYHKHVDGYFYNPGEHYGGTPKEDFTEEDIRANATVKMYTMTRMTGPARWVIDTPEGETLVRMID